MIFNTAREEGWEKGRTKGRDEEKIISRQQIIRKRLNKQTKLTKQEIEIINNSKNLEKPEQAIDMLFEGNRKKEIIQFLSE